MDWSVTCHLHNGGSASDRQIVEATGMATMFDPYDEIMADKGFNVDDIFAPYQVGVNIPDFFRKRIDCNRQLSRRTDKLRASLCILNVL